jgi:hypothetical protein
MTEFLLKTQKKLDLFVSLLTEVENAKADIDNDYHSLPLSLRNSYTFQPISAGFFQLCHSLLYKDNYPNLRQIEILRKKINDDLTKRCKHQFVEDDIECNMENTPISYCILCEIKKTSFHKV